MVALAIAILSFLRSTPVVADLSREAGKTDVVGEEGQWVLETAMERERDHEGRVWTLESGLLHTFEPLPRLSLLLEPVIWEWERPNDGPNVDGNGDTDLTLAYLLHRDEGPFPAVVVAGKVKFPTANNREIGIGKADYSAILTLGKEWGNLEVNLELEFATFGQPALEREPLEPSGTEEEDREESEGTWSEQAFDFSGSDLAMTRYIVVSSRGPMG
ncbi:MAG: hypothetical protein PHG55_00415 [Verrucomicrobiota bacterium]|nr:hypothetical protein [Verrucomicrobiota bacterium]MDD8049777.1 hypothetical protein [Verrucomicrobiota bacterium]